MREDAAWRREGDQLSELVYVIMGIRAPLLPREVLKGAQPTSTIAMDVQLNLDNTNHYGKLTLQCKGYF